MSLNLDPIDNCDITAGTVTAGLTAWPTTADLSENFGDGTNLIEVFIDTSAGPVVLTPVALVDANTPPCPLTEGSILKFINLSKNPIEFTDRNGMKYDFAKGRSSFICVKYVGGDPTLPASYIVI